MNDEELKRAQKCQLEIANEINRICKKNDINYFVAYGTMIGAVRHQGFIPWDDDLDIAMLRDDYNKFISACNKDLSDGYFLQTFETDPFYGWPFAKVLKKGTVYKEVWVPDRIQNGIFVDVFPIDKASTDGKGATLDHVRYRFYLRTLQIKLGYKGFLDVGIHRKIIRSMIWILSCLFSRHFLKSRLEKVLLKYDHTNSKYVHNLNSPYSEEKERMPISWFQKTQENAFENVSLPILTQYDDYLRHIYGDYMVLPPESERKNRHKIQEFRI